MDCSVQRFARMYQWRQGMARMMSKKTEEMLEKNFKNRYEMVINDDLYNAMPRSVLWAIVVRLLRNAGWSFGKIDQAILETWAQLWKESYVRVEPPEDGLLALRWLDPKDQGSVIYAANVWGIEMGLAWEVIDVAVRAEIIPATIGETEFKAWVDEKMLQWKRMEEAKRKREADPLVLMPGIGTVKRPAHPQIKKILDGIDDT
jgi:hypothetical protein